ncbi:hypothetical protein [Longispora fulva]|uniref:Uncharacterized protein n=1 Tax=Longispora fulva TaxID=619741 RepID=A0A8J7KZ19_9ACTN|nr:hypothetical protein [Longispora fulva]MBG6139982.1 hypothetical protein [Longispora fulva]
MDDWGWARYTRGCTCPASADTSSAVAWVPDTRATPRAATDW